MTISCRNKIAMAEHIMLIITISFLAHFIQRPLSVQVIFKFWTFLTYEDEDAISIVHEINRKNWVFIVGNETKNLKSDFFVAKLLMNLKNAN